MNATTKPRRPIPNPELARLLAELDACRLKLREHTAAYAERNAAHAASLGWWSR